MELLMRNATIEDSVMLLGWRNDDDVRRHAGSQLRIPVDEHRRWLNERLRLIPEEPFWIFENRQNIIGFVRLDFEVSHQHFKVSLIVNPLMRGEGFGKKILNQAVSQSQIRNPEVTLCAEIHKKNFASQKIFAACGFKRFDSTGELLVFKRIANLD